MSAHDWRQWTPAAMPHGTRWRLIRFDAVGADGKPVGRCIVNKSPAGEVRTFPSEAAAQGCADWLNGEGAEDCADA